MSYILANMVLTPDSQLVGFVEFDKPWELGDGGNIRHYFSGGYDYYGPVGEKHELTEELRAQIPTRLTLRIPKRGMPDFCFVGREHILSQRVKDKLEELEPGVHEFFPLIIEDVKTGGEHKDYYLTYIWQRPDIIDHDNTVYRLERVSGGVEARKNGFKLPLIRETAKPHSGPYYFLNFKENGHKGHHLWRGTQGVEWIKEQIHGQNGKKIYPDQLTGTIFVSDEFAEFMRKEKITGTKPLPIIEKPLAWYQEKLKNGEYK